jgi:AcrR family transcriptional regulator
MAGMPATPAQPSPYPLRRVPTQDRASQQVEKILDAAVADVNELGYDAASTSTIAKRAEIAVGSVYRYFPDKRTLMQAVARRNQARYGELVAARVLSGDVTDWRQAVDVTLDLYVELNRSDPGYRAIALTGIPEPLLESRVGEFDDTHADEFSALLIDHFGATDSDDFRIAIRLAIAVGESIGRLVNRLPAPAGDSAVRQARTALRALLAPHHPA